MAITALKNQEKNKPVGGWISVKDQPPEGDRIFVTDGEAVIATHREWLYRTPEKVLRAPANYGNGMTVTHWMPLPEPPKERDGDV